MEIEEFVRKVHVSEIMDPNSRGRPLGRWKDRVKKYMCEVVEWVKRNTLSLFGCIERMTRGQFVRKV